MKELTKVQLRDGLQNGYYDGAISQYDLMTMFMDKAPTEWDIEMHSYEAREGLFTYADRKIPFGFLDAKYGEVDEFNAHAFVILLTELCLRYHCVELTHPVQFHPSCYAYDNVERNGKLTTVHARGGVPQVWGGHKQSKVEDHLFECVLRAFLYHLEFTGYRHRRDASLWTSDMDHALDIVKILHDLDSRGWRISLSKYGLFDPIMLDRAFEWRVGAYPWDRDTTQAHGNHHTSAGTIWDALQNMSACINGGF